MGSPSEIPQGAHVVERVVDKVADEHLDAHGRVASVADLERRRPPPGLVVGVELVVEGIRRVCEVAAARSGSVHSRWELASAATYALKW